MATATMVDVSNILSPGMHAIVQRTVEKGQTGKDYGGGVMDDLLTTPAFVDLMIRAAIKAVDRHLPDGFVTVGRSMEFTHESPTGTGMSVSILATLTEIEGKLLIFDIIASDELGAVGRGRHERVVVNRDDWTQKVQARLKPIQNIKIK